MMTRGKKKGVGVLAAVMAVSLAAGVALGLTGETLTATAERSPAWVTIDEIYDDSNSKFKFQADELEKLYQALAGSTVTTIEELESAMVKKGGSLTSADFRENNGGRNVSVYFGEKKWDAVYLTKTTNGTEGGTQAGDIIFDLWRSADTLTSDDIANYSVWREDKATNSYPSNMYSTSRIRVETLNAGGKYSTSGSDLTEYAQNEDNQYARFTMSEADNSLTQYLAKPSEVGYQAKEWDEATATSVDAGKYYFPNDTYDEPQGGEWYDNYNYLADNRDTDREDGAKYGSWKDDYLWLPFLTEVGTEDGNGNGIWDTDVSLRSAIRETYNYYWLRSGARNRPDHAYVVYDYGACDSQSVHNSAKVRPALHLNLTAAARTAAVARVTDEASGTTTDHSTIGEAWTAAKTAGSAATVKLLGNATTEITLTVEAGDNITLDLNGKTLKMTGSGSVLSVTAGSLTLTDSAPEEGSHEIKDPTTTSGNLIITGGLITGGNATNGGGVSVTDGTFNMSGGTITGCAAENGAGVYMTGGTFTMSNLAKITGNQATGTADKEGLGGGVYINGGTFTMNGGTISDNEALRGAGVEINKGTFEMTSGTISGNKANVASNEGYGGGVEINEGTFTMTGGEISKNNQALRGAGVYIGNKGEFTMSGEASITRNTATGNGNGVFVTEKGQFKMTGGSIQENKTNSPDVYIKGKSDDGSFTWGGGKIGTVYLGTGAYIDVQAGFTPLGVDEEKITIQIQANIADGDVKVLEWTAGDPFSNFKSAIEEACYYRNGTEAYIGKHSPEQNGKAEWTDFTSVTFKVKCGHDGCTKSKSVTVTGADITSSETQKQTCTQDGKTTYTAEVTFDDVKDVFTADFSTWGTDIEDTQVKTTGAAKHKWEYTAEGAVLTATCTNNEAHDESIDGAKTITATLSAPEDKTYKGGGIEAKVEVSDDAGFPGGYDVTYWEYTGPTDTDYTELKSLIRTVGKYQARLTAKGDNREKNEKATAIVDFTITKATLTLTIVKATVEYGESATKENVEFSWSGLQGDDLSSKGAIEEALKKAVTFNFGGYYAGTPVSQKDIIVTAVVNTDDISDEGYKEILKNYTIVIVKKTLTITPAELTITWTEKIFTYTGDVIGPDEYPTVTVAGRKNSDDVSVTIAPDKEFKNAGSYTFTATLGGTAAGNYTIKDADKTHGYTIEKATVKAPEASAFKSKVYNGDDQEVFIDGSAQYKLQANSGKGKNVGHYTVIIELKDADNYKWEDEPQATESSPKTYLDAFEITQYELTITWSVSTNADRYSYVYGTAEKPSATADFQGDDEKTMSVKVEPNKAGQPDFKNVGTYEFKATIEGDTAGNYTIKTGETQTYTITRARLQASLSATVVYGDDFGKDNVTVTISNGTQYTDSGAALAAEAKEKISAFTTNYQKGTTAAGASGVRVSYGDTVELDNYIVEFTSGTVTVQKRRITLTLGGGTNVYGDGNHGEITVTATRADGEGDWYGNAADQALLAEGAGYIFTFKKDGTGSAEDYAPTLGAGTYTIVVKLTGTLDENYQLVGEPATNYTITKATLTVSAKDMSITYGDEPPHEGTNANVTITGFKNDENDSVVGGTVKFNHAYGQYQNVGTYGFTVEDISGLTADNYTFVLDEDSKQGRLTVDPKEITAKITPPDITYGQEFGVDAFTVTFDGVEACDKDDVSPVRGFSGTAYDGTVASGETVPTQAGNQYTVWVLRLTGAKAGNYKIKGDGQIAFEIKRAQLTAGLSASVVYGDEIGPSDVTVTVTESELKNGDNAETIKGQVYDAAKAYFRYHNYNAGTTGVDSTNARVSVNRDGRNSVDIQNYTVTFPSDGEITVTAREIRVELSGKRSNTYGDTEHGEIIVSATRDGGGDWFGREADKNLLKEDEGLTITFYTGTDPSAAKPFNEQKMVAGIYTIVVELTDKLATNYKLVGVTGNKYTVDRKKLHVTLTAEVIYGDDIDEENDVHLNLAPNEKLVSGDNLTAILAEAKEKAEFDFDGYDAGETGYGTYDLTAPNADITNYTVVFDPVANNLTVRQRKIEVTVGGKLQHTYGDTPASPTLDIVRLNDEDGEMEGAAWGNSTDEATFREEAVYTLVKGESRVALNAGAPAGDYMLTLAWDNANYAVTAVGVSYTVEKANLTVTFKAAVTYGDDATTMKVTAVSVTGGLKNGDVKSDIEAAAKDAAKLTDYGGYKAGTPVSDKSITVKAEGTLANYNVTYESAAGNLAINKREITAVNESAASGDYTGEGQSITVSFDGLYSGDGGFEIGTDYTIAYSANGGTASLEGGLPLTVGNYYVTVELTSATAANYIIVDVYRFGYEITPAEIGEAFKDGFKQDRDELYSADETVTYPLELPAQGSEDFPLVLKGNDNGIVNEVTLHYIVLSHKEGVGHDDIVDNIEKYLQDLRDGAQDINGVSYTSSVAPVREPMGYCVFFKAEAPNHETYYGYFTLHIYHEMLTITMKEGGLTFTSEYGDVPHTDETLFELVFQNIQSITATKEDGTLSEDKTTQFEGESEHFHFYFTKGRTEYDVDEVLDVGTYTLSVRYAKTDTEGGESYIKFVWGNGAPTMTVTPRRIKVTLDGTFSNVYGSAAHGAFTAKSAARETLAGAWYGKKADEELLAEGKGLAFTFQKDGAGAATPYDVRMAVGDYTIVVTLTGDLLKNYELVGTEGTTYEVTPKDLRVTVTASVVYGDDLVQADVEAKITDGLVTGDIETAIADAALAARLGHYTLVGYEKGKTHAGDTGVTVRADSVVVGNYNVIYTAGGVTVKPRKIQVTLGGDRSNTYGAETYGEITPSAERADGKSGAWNENTGDTLNFTYKFQAAGKEAAAYSPDLRVDTYTIAIVWDNGDYEIVGTVEGATYTVTKATLTYDTPAGGQYNTEARKLLETLTGVVGDTLHRGTDYDVFYDGVKYDGHSDSILPKNTGSYAVRIELKGEAANNYVLAEGKDRFTYVIARHELAKPTGSDTSYDYNGEERALTVNGFDGTTMAAKINNVNTNSAKIVRTNAGTYTVTITIRDASNYCWADGTEGEVTFTLTIDPVDLTENENFDALKDREGVYNLDEVPLAMPNQSNEKFPFDVPGGDLVKVYYIVTEHREGEHSDAKLEADFNEFKKPENADLWKLATADMYAVDPGGYCVYFKIVDEAGNHNIYYGYYTVHIYHEEITIYLDDEIVNGHYNVEYGDVAHTQDELRERLYKHIVAVTAGKNPEDGDALTNRLDKQYFTFYLIDEKGEEHYLAETDSGDRLPVGEYTIGVRYLETGEKARYIRLHWHNDTPPDFTIMPRRIDLTATFEGHTYGETPAALIAQLTLSAVRSNGKEGNWFGKSGETLDSLNLIYSLASFGEHMDAGTYAVQIDCGNPNYEVTVVSATYIVSPRTLTADFGAFGDLTYGAANDPEAFIRDGILWNDDVELSIVSYAGTANDGTAYTGSGIPTLAGNYTVTVQLAGAKSNNYALEGYTHDFTIKRAVYDMSGVTFADGTFKGDGSAHGLTATGLPNGVTASYTGNGRTEPGIYEVVAYFTGDADNYEAIPARSATLTVLRMRIQSYLDEAHEKDAAPDLVVESTNGLDPTLELRVQKSGQEAENAVTSSEAFDGGLVGVYDLGLYKDDTKVEPSDAFTVRLLIPEDLRGKEFHVLSVQGGEVTEVEYTVDGDYIVITANSLSSIAFTYANVSLILPIIITATVLLLGIIALAFEIKSMKEKRKLG